VPLRLTVTRGRLGMELYEPLTLGPIHITALALSLPGLRFPLDLSGGVPAFRHRRGKLELLRLELGPAALVRWMTPRLQEVVGVLERPPGLWFTPTAVGIGLLGVDGCVAFDLLWVPDESTARWVVARARGFDLNGPALGYALRAMDSVLAGFGERRGRIVSVPATAQQLLRSMLPPIGARVPSSAQVRFGQLMERAENIAVELDASFAPPAPSCSGAAALELAHWTATADDALAAGEADAARAAYHRVLERAPRHPEVVRLIAEIDACVPDRVEAALSMLVETEQATRTGAVGATLLARMGDLEAAGEALAAAAREELYSPLRALLWLGLARLQTQPLKRARTLDQAVADCPDLARVRWARFETRLGQGDIQDALADAEYLEASASGLHRKHRAMRRAAEAFLSAGRAEEAAGVFERSLRYLPEDPEAVAGLAGAMHAAGDLDRATALYERAIRLAGKSGRVEDAATLEFAKLLASHVRDLPAAIARVRQVGADSRFSAEARVMEARWRLRIGDVTGASLAYGRAREAVELSPATPSSASAWLVEASRFEREVQRDLAAAERHLAIALRVDPKNEEVATAYRRAAAATAARQRRERQLPGASQPEEPSPPPGSSGQEDPTVPPRSG
jgi:tetratricopeptide (TPR) repeat protein